MFRRTRTTPSRTVSMSRGKKPANPDWRSFDGPNFFTKAVTDELKETKEAHLKEIKPRRRGRCSSPMT